MKVQLAKAALLSLSLSLPVAVLSAQIPAAGLCNTGLTAASSLPGVGCTTSVPVTPVNPATGGPSVDGNWQLASPYPSGDYEHQAPDPCTLKTFGPAWVDSVYSQFNPADGISEWISPLSEQPSVGGWYVYRTAVPTPAASGGGKYLFTVTGHLLADDQVPVIAIENPAGDILGCKIVAAPSLTNTPATTTGAVSFKWDPFEFAKTVKANSELYIYVVVFNVGNPDDSENATHLRVEFTSAYFTPE